MPEIAYSKKARVVLADNFKQVAVNCNKVGDRAMEMLTRLNLENLASCVKKAKSLELEVFLLLRRISRAFYFAP